MDPFFPAMVLTSLCLAATKVYRHLRPNDQQPHTVQSQQDDGDNLKTADSTANGSQETTFSAAASSSRTSSQESPGLCDEKDTDDDNDFTPSRPLTALPPVTPPPSPPRMTRQYAFYKSIHHERALLPTCLDQLISDDEEQVTQKHKDTSIPSQVITKNDNQAQHGSTTITSTTSTAAQRYRAKKPWLIPQSATSKATPNTRYPTRASASHHPRQRHMISSSIKKIYNDKASSYSSNESALDFSIPSTSQATPPMTRQYAFCGSGDTSSSTSSSSTSSSSSTNAAQNQERRTRLTSPELMPPPPPRPPRRHIRPLLRRQNAFFADTLNHTMLASKRKRRLMDENMPPPSDSRDVRQRLNTDNA